jgi:hypothetical protein
MECPSCGKQLAPGAAFCNRCRRRVPRLSLSLAAASDAAAPPLAAALRSPSARPRVLTALAALDFVWAGIVLAPAAVLATRLARNDSTPAQLVTIGALALLSGVAVVAGMGLIQLEEYGRKTQLGLSALLLPLVPLGTLVAILLYAYLGKPRTRWLFAGPGAPAPPGADAPPGREHGLALAAVVLGFLVAAAVAAAIAVLLLAGAS